MSDKAVPVEIELEYLTRREAQERAAAERSVDLGARRVHSELANRYANRLRIAGGPRAA
jgi:hypothetical protein